MGMQNQSRYLADQAELCANACLHTLGVQRDPLGKVLPFETPKENEPLFSANESECIENCTSKVFATDKAMRGYLPIRISSVNLTENKLQQRLNNPTDSIGPYFLSAEYEAKLKA